MNRIIVLSALNLVLVLGIACSPRKAATPAVEPPMLTKEIALQQYSSAQIAEGEALNNAKCGTCHKLYAAGQFAAPRWHQVLNRMLPKAKTTAEEGKLIRAYIIANSRSVN
ncbi:MAG: hypothetical protein EOP54_07030 [Sphingobacteriales bacterium]|nr:MAG: hypothetical protein EOP54_07030 [Sphingobacteriales bacterium]